MKLLAYKVAGATALAAVWVASAGASDGHGYRSSEHRDDSGDKKGGYSKEVKQDHKKAETTTYKAVVPAQKHEAVKYDEPKSYEHMSAKPVYEVKKYDEPKQVAMPVHAAPKVDMPKVEVTVTVPNVSHYMAPKHEVAEPKKYEPKHDYDQNHDYGKGSSYEAPKHDYKPVKHEEYREHEASRVHNTSYQTAHTGNVTVHHYQPKHDYDQYHDYGYGKNDYRARDYAYAHRYDERDYNRGVRVSYHYNQPVHVYYTANTVRHDCDGAHAYGGEHHYGDVSHVSYHYAPVHHVVYQPVTVYVPVVTYQPVVYQMTYVHQPAYVHQPVHHYEHGMVHHASTHGYAYGKSAAWRVKAVFAARHAAHYASMYRHNDCDRAKTAGHMTMTSHHVVKTSHHVAQANNCGHVAKAKDCGHMAARTMVRHHA